MSSAIVQITSALTYLRFSATYQSTTQISATTLWQQDFFTAVMQLCVPVYLFIHLVTTACTREWFGLRGKLVERRRWYAKRHWELMC
jgi:hypothetical protein